MTCLINSGPLSANSYSLLRYAVLPTKAWALQSPQTKELSRIVRTLITMRGYVSTNRAVGDRQKNLWTGQQPNTTVTCRERNLWLSFFGIRYVLCRLLSLGIEETEVDYSVSWESRCVLEPEPLSAHMSGRRLLLVSVCVSTHTANDHSVE